MDIVRDILWTRPGLVRDSHRTVTGHVHGQSVDADVTWPYLFFSYLTYTYLYCVYRLPTRWYTRRYTKRYLPEKPETNVRSFCWMRPASLLNSLYRCLRMASLERDCLCQTGSSVSRAAIT